MLRRVVASVQFFKKDRVVVQTAEIHIKHVKHSTVTPGTQQERLWAGQGRRRAERPAHHGTAPEDGRHARKAWSSLVATGHPTEQQSLGSQGHSDRFGADGFCLFREDPAKDTHEGKLALGTRAKVPKCFTPGSQRYGHQAKLGGHVSWHYRSFLF